MTLSDKIRRAVARYRAEYAAPPNIVLVGTDVWDALYEELNWRGRYLTIDSIRVVETPEIKYIAVAHTHEFTESPGN